MMLTFVEVVPAAPILLMMMHATVAGCPAAMRLEIFHKDQAPSECLAARATYQHWRVNLRKYMSSLTQVHLPFQN